LAWVCVAKVLEIDFKQDVAQSPSGPSSVKVTQTGSLDEEIGNGLSGRQIKFSLNASNV